MAEAHISDPRMLRALAHPLRGRLLGLLRLEGPSTASRLAERLGESSGATSYHLRQLADYGMVVDAAGRGTGRERWWQAAHRSTSWDPDELVRQPGGLEANELMQRQQAETMGRELASWLERGRSHGEQWAGVAGLSDYVLRLTPAETRQVLQQVYSVLDDWAARTKEPRPGTAPVNVFVSAFPRTS